MNATLLESKFGRIGARLKVSDGSNLRWPPVGGPVRLDVRHDREGEYFEILKPPATETEVEVVDVQPKGRHLLLMLRERGEKHKFLCGHDERHWFVAAIPESAGGVGTVRTAKEALKPVEVKAVQARERLSGRGRERRKNSAYVRQGEWFFLPAPRLNADPRAVLRDEPLVRGNGGKPHWADFCYRFGGETVYVCRRFPNGLDQESYRRLLEREPKAQSWGWQTMIRNAEVYVRGRIRHPDHRTITLHVWHKVFMNTESQAQAMRNVAFLD